MFGRVILMFIILIFQHISSYVCLSVGKCSFFGKFDVLCFLETLVLRFALLPYYRQIMINLIISHYLCIPAITPPAFTSAPPVSYVTPCKYRAKQFKVLLKIKVYVTIFLYLKQLSYLSY